MTEDEILTSADEWLSSGLDAAYWASLDAGTKAAAVRTATQDVLARLPGMTEERLSGAKSAAVLAIAEQAVYLARNYGAQTAGKVITSESVSGISVGYTLIGDGKDAGISPRALSYLKAARRAALCAGLRFQRG